MSYISSKLKQILEFQGNLLTLLKWDNVISKPYLHQIEVINFKVIGELGSKKSRLACMKDIIVGETDDF